MHALPRTYDAVPGVSHAHGSTTEPTHHPAAFTVDMVASPLLDDGVLALGTGLRVNLKPLVAKRIS